MNYPTGVKKSFINNEKIKDYKNRGMNLESDINSTNEYYINKEIAYVYKKPTPIKLVKVDYKKGKIQEFYHLVFPRNKHGHRNSDPDK